jgi:hypothetical protein
VLSAINVLVEGDNAIATFKCQRAVVEEAECIGYTRTLPNKLPDVVGGHGAFTPIIR